MRWFSPNAFVDIVTVTVNRECNGGSKKEAKQAFKL